MIELGFNVPSTHMSCRVCDGGLFKEVVQKTGPGEAKTSNCDPRISKPANL